MKTTLSTTTHLSYSIRVQKVFTDLGVYEGKTVTLIDSELREIAYEDYDGQTNLEEVVKMFYGKDGTIFYFFYNVENGELLSMAGNKSPFVDEMPRISVKEVDFYFPGFLEEHPYYADATFLPTEKTQ